MDSQNVDTKNYLQLLSAIKSFRGPDAYIIDTIRKVATLPVKPVKYFSLRTSRDVANLLSAMRLNLV